MRVPIKVRALMMPWEISGTGIESRGMKWEKGMMKKDGLNGIDVGGQGKGENMGRE